MKKLFTVLICSTLLLSCSSSEIESSDIDKIKSQCEDFLKTKLNDPSSYERISIEVKDSVHLSKSLMEDFERPIIAFSETEDSIAKLIKDSIMKKITDLKKNPNKDTLKYIAIQIQYRAKNSFNALTIGNATIYYKTIAWGEPSKFFMYSNK